MLRGIKTSEFWVILGSILLSVVTSYQVSIEDFAKTVGDQVVSGTPPVVWTAFGSTIAAGLYAVARGLAKSTIFGGSSK